ncbi:uncharacterized protein CIMG_04240 [Coccidioides immitis RS]|uniref:Sedlin n=4 Tax=Coccidioides immitis TaxID=5501 RepID=J3KD35_COCIM|nr:uncharacterized protein CIMG_04240 [Coccidioides immitis RS]KMP08515.1 hypothetical protein CIRG_08196 [Coccidioides immitis RMSCC 2394]KMU82107.1 hypothetical protein CISG_09637 [Coccidioides immitis RMSCC 3703]KMU87328.1 hypothetical protein CIHG_04773 [Coccidioides immitis H538.4]TPX20118.1 hypothetical protein DIZ76_017915 [Coccidioides immitis]EAS33216.3 hypothetical protein CIMG_04240 [Coccidioides immitis RS]
MGTPSIASIGIIGKSDNLLHISVFPPHQSAQVEFSLAFNSSLDVLELRQHDTSVDQDFGLLHALDERFSVYGWLTNTGVKFLIIVDLEGRVAVPGKFAPLAGLRESDLKPAFRALQTAYMKLLQNPFYDPDRNNTDCGEPATSNIGIKNHHFIAEVNRIGELWVPGMVNV